MILKVYLPISEKTIDTLLQGEGPLDLSPDFSISEAIGLFALQQLPMDHEAPAGIIEVALGNLLEKFNEHVLIQKQDMFREQILGLLNREQLKPRINQMSRWGLFPVLPSTIVSRQFLTPHGRWDTNFKERYTGETYGNEVVPGLEGITGRLTDGQVRIVGSFSANLDDPLNIHGYAGTGKTYLLNLLLDLLQKRGIKSERIFLVCLSTAQVRSIKSKIPSTYHAQAMTFGHLVGRTYPVEYWSRLDYEKNRKPLNHDNLISLYGIQHTAGLSPFYICQTINWTIWNYCFSSDRTIQENHLPKKIQEHTEGGWKDNQILKAKILQTAQDLWKKTFDLTFKDFLIPIKDYHRIKFAAEQRFTLGSQYSHVLIDESHDATPAMRQFLDASPHILTISLGDGFQNTSATFHDVSRDIKTLDLGRSYRSGRNMEELVVPITQNHRFVPPDIYRGSSDIHTEISYYKELPEIPKTPTGILVSDHWALWEWVVRISKAGGRFRFLGFSYDQRAFVDDVFALKDHGTRPNHWSLSKYFSWNQLVTDCLNTSPGFKTIFSWLEQGHSKEEYLQAMATAYLSDYALGDHQNAHVLGRAESARNHEFDQILLTPDMTAIVSRASQSVIQQSIQKSALYITLTRSKFCVRAPIGIREWIEEIS